MRSSYRMSKGLQIVEYANELWSISAPASLLGLIWSFFIFLFLNRGLGRHTRAFPGEQLAHFEAKLNEIGIYVCQSFEDTRTAFMAICSEPRTEFWYVFLVRRQDHAHAFEHIAHPFQELCVIRA
jgi:hypothetical protein